MAARSLARLFGDQRRRRLARTPHPGLLDTYTLRQRLGGLDGRHVAIIGDIRHSRVAGSTAFALAAMGARVTFVAPPTLLPASLEGWPVEVSHDLDAVLPTIDVAYTLRMQLERQRGALVPSLREFTNRYGLTAERASHLPDHALVMHPGPMNRGVEIAAEVADGPRSVILDQVRNGVPIRMAVLFLLLGSGRPEHSTEGAASHA
jgi:aspartate carbamoyltransferase catalytic subunit